MIGRPASVEVAGPPDGPAIVLLHGTRLSRTSWRPVMRRVAPWARAIAVDLPGHGERADTPFTIDDAVATVTTALDAEAGGRAVVVGLSLGGYVAMEVAARHPERVRALVLAGASQDPVGFWSIGFRALGFILGRLPTRTLDAVSRTFFRIRYPPDVAEAILDGQVWSRGGAVAVRAITGRRYRPTLAAYPGPVLLLNGEFDVLFRAGERPYLDAAADARRITVKRATHLVNLDRPDAFSAALRTFVMGLPPDQVSKA